METEEEAPCFDPKPCSTCTGHATGFFRIKDGRLCFLCLDFLRHKKHLRVDDIHELTIEEVKLIQGEIDSDDQRSNERNEGKVQE